MWTREELQQMNQRTYDGLYQRDEIDRLYMSTKGGRGHDSIEYIVDTSIRQLGDYIKKSKEKQLYGYFKRQTSKISHVKMAKKMKRKP